MEDLAPSTSTNVTEKKLPSSASSSHQGPSCSYELVDDVHINFRIVKFFIKDLLEYTKEDKYFVVRNQKFLCVDICGVILDHYYHKQKIALTVHDGSGSVTCLLDSKFLNSVPPIPIKYEEIPKEKSSYTDACKYLLSALKQLHSKIPKNIVDLNPSTYVEIQGKLSDYGGKLYVFIEKINLRTCEEYMNYLHTTLKRYEQY